MNTHDIQRLADTRFLRCSPFRSRAETRRYPMVHSYETLLVITGGRMWWERGGDQYTATTGDVVHHPAHLPYVEWTCERTPVRGVIILFQWAGAPPITLAPCIGDRTGTVPALAARMVSAWGYSTDARIRGPRPTISMLFAGLLAEVVELNMERLPEMAQRVHDYVIANLSRPIQVSELAVLFRYHPSYFVRKFTAATGHSPSEFVRRTKLAAARDLAVNTDLLVKEIADAVGLADGPHLSRLFRRHFGVSIRELRTGLVGKTPRGRGGAENDDENSANV